MWKTIKPIIPIILMIGLWAIFVIFKPTPQTVRAITVFDEPRVNSKSISVVQI